MTLCWVSATAGRWRGGGPAEMVEQRVAREELAAKLVQAEPLARAGSRPLQRTGEGHGGVVPARPARVFDSMAGANSLRSSACVSSGSRSSAPICRGGERGLTPAAPGLFRPRGAATSPAREMAGMLKPPTVHCSVPEVLRLGPAVYPAPRTLRRSRGSEGSTPLGRVTARTASAGRAASRGLLLQLHRRPLAGRARPSFALTQARTLPLRSRRAVPRPPPGRREAAEVLPDRESSRSGSSSSTSSGERSREGQPGWNLFAAGALTRAPPSDRVEAIVDCFASALQWGERNNRALTLTTQATGALIELAAVLPEGLQPTIFQDPSILGNPSGWRRRCRSSRRRAASSSPSGFRG